MVKIIEIVKTHLILISGVTIVFLSMFVIDSAPLIFNAFPTVTTTGCIQSSEPYSGHIDAGLTNIYHFKYHDCQSNLLQGISWAPTLDSSRSIFWKPFPILPMGQKVEVEYLKWNPQVARIKKMRNSNLPLDIVGVELVFLILAIAANSKKLGNSVLFVNRNDHCR